MRTHAIAIGLALGAALTTASQAATARCFDSFGAPVGPVFDTLYPNHHWIRWIEARGGTCRSMMPDEAALYSSRVIDYPPEYTMTLAPGTQPSSPGVLRSQPPTTETSVWLGNTAHAAELVTVAYAQRGRPVASVADTSRVIYRADGVWRVYDVAWRDGYFRQIAVHMRPNGGYFAIESNGGDGWSEAVFIGR